MVKRNQEYIAIMSIWKSFVGEYTRVDTRKAKDLVVQVCSDKVLCYLVRSQFSVTTLVVYRE